MCACRRDFLGAACAEDRRARFVSFDGEDHHVCGILPSGDILCRGSNVYGESSPPPGPFTQVAVGYEHTCALRANGEVVCFGSEHDAQTTVPAETFTQITARIYGTCGIKTDGSVICWGAAASQTLSGTFTSVDMTVELCGVRTNGTAACSLGPAPNESPLVKVTAGGARSFGLTDTGTIVSTGSPSPLPLAGPFVTLSAGDLTDGIAVRADGTLVHWDYEDWPMEDTLKTLESYSGTFQDAVIGEERLCALHTDGTLGCTVSAEPEALAGTFVDLAQTDIQVCGLHADGSLRCFGVGGWGGTTLPGPFVEWHEQCGLDPSGGLQLRTTTVAGPYKSVARAPEGCCAIHEDGELSCFDSSGVESQPVSGTFTRVAGSVKTVCAILSDGSLSCWGSNSYGQATPPAGTFTEVAVGPNHACAIRSDATLACWGRDDNGEAEPPAGSFLHVTANGGHSCGIRTDGTIACWGLGSNGQTTPPAGTFARISAAGLATCALSTAGEMTCFGDRHVDFADLSSP